jgi:hypothetical protein
MHFIGNKMSNKKHGIRYNTTSYIEKAREVHSNLYDYSLVEYKNSFTKIKIVCPIHGIFEQRSCDHINQKQGCPKCSHNHPWTSLQYSLKSKELYDNKFEVISEYKGMKHPITLRCNDHGNFTLKKAEKHLERSGGCPVCWYLGRLENLKPGNISKVETEWLDSLSVPLRQHKLNIGNQTFLVDGFDPTTNTVYECYGSFWHGNPAEYKSFGQLYDNTIARENVITQHYKLITKWV